MAMSNWAFFKYIFAPVSRSNVSRIKDITSDEKEFVWRLTQDMLKIGARKHWGGDPLRRKECRVRFLDEQGTNRRCNEEETRRHVFGECVYSRNKIFSLKSWLADLLQAEISTTSLIHLDFSTTNTDKLKTALWLAVKGLRRIYLFREEGWKEYVGFLKAELEMKQRWRSLTSAERNLSGNIVSAFAVP